MEKIRVFCKNTNKYYSTKPGTRLVDFLKEIKYKEGEHRVLAAYVNNQLKGLGFEFYIASTFIVGYSCLGIAWMQRYLERAVLFVIRFLFTLISVVISIPFLSIALFVNVKTGEITKLGKLVSKKYEKNFNKT